MQDIVVLGAGFAGVWAAAGAVRTAEEAGRERDVRVTVVAPNDDLVIRPRLYEDRPERMRVSLDRVLGPIGVRRVVATVTGVDTDARTVTALGRDGETIELTYDRLVVATGSSLVTPDLPGAEHLFDVDTMPAAARLYSHVQSLPRRADAPGAFTAVVVGAGFTGLEIASEMPARLASVADGRPARVVLIDRGEELAETLGAGPRPQIAAALDAHGIEVRQGAAVAELDAHGATLDSGERIDAATVVWTAGMRASRVTEGIPADRDDLGRLPVDEHLRVVGVPGVFAAGDTAAALAEEGHVVMQACQHAVPLGKHAGHNVAADLLGLDLVTFDPHDYVTCLDLGPGHAVYTTGWDREVQMTGEDAKKLKHQINGEWIYPPVDDRDAILDLADYRRTWPIDPA